MQLSTRCQPTTFSWHVRMWRAMDTGCQTSMRPLKNFHLTSCWVTKELRPIEDSREPMWVQNSVLGNKRRRLVGGPIFETMGVASSHIQNPTPPYSIYIWACLLLFTLEYGERHPTWKLTFRHKPLPYLDLQHYYLHDVENFDGSNILVLTPNVVYDQNMVVNNSL